MNLIDSKSLLAKLMATENLVVEQRNVRTASFDTAKRILTIPTLDDKISGYLYDLFLGHEVGHALYTPQDGLRKAYELKLPQSITNVLEDVRIEKKIKNKYPGIRSSFIKGYRELVEKDFFGTSDVDLNELNFIDRVNLFTKGGAQQGIRFEKEIEKVLLKKIESTETYEDVIKLAQEVMDYLKQEKEERDANRPQFVEDEDGDEEFESYGYEDSDEDSQGDEEIDSLISKDPNNSDDDGDNDDDGNDGDSSTGGMDPKGESEQTIKSHTDEAFRKNESKLFADENKQYYYGNIPDVDLKKAVVPYKELWARYRTDVKERSINWAQEFTGLNTKEFLKLRNDSKKVVGYLAKEFELRKNADQLKRASISKTGDLNMNKIYAYQLIDDIFKKMTVVPGAKSHGLVMFLDWSGSMHNHLANTVKQLINLVMFCKKVNIPFDVYCFTQEYDDPYTVVPKEGDIQSRSFKLLNILSSKMSASEFTYAGSALVQMTGGYRRCYMPSWFTLGGTPLNESIISAMKIVPEFQKQYKLQIVNTVFLTDGEGHSLNEVYYDGGEGRLYSNRSNGGHRDYNYRGTNDLIIRDPITKHHEKTENNHGRNLTTSYLKMLKARTNSNIVGFFVLAGREFSREAYHFFGNNPMVIDSKRAEFRKNKSLVVTSAGYDEYYLLRAEGLDTDEDVEFEVKENATTRGLVSAFNKYAGNRLANRVVLNRFVGMIS
jgi:hypothetical protein